MTDTVEYGEAGGGAQAAAEGPDVEEEGSPFVAEEEEAGWPEYPWWPVLADAIETALRSMSLDELNDRMAVSRVRVWGVVVEGRLLCWLVSWGLVICWFCLYCTLMG